MSRLLAASFLFAILLSACSSRYSAPVDDLDETPRFIDSGRTHRVNDGETLYVVAWMYDLDFAALARVNNLREPYTITPGQILSVDLRGVPQTRAPAPGTARATPAAVTTGIQRTPLESAPLTRQALPGAGTPPAQSTTPSPAQTPPQAAPAPAATPPVSAAPPPQQARRELPPPTPTAPTIVAPARELPPPSLPVDPDAPIVWAWPARGNVIGRFSDSNADNKGIKLGGSEGETVMAAADGEVVYAGNGLLRYGELVILKHSERFLSAYAHNKVITVKEGDLVARGQKIAELGSTGIDRDMLHFEIRLDGEPVDPLVYLPTR